MQPALKAAARPLPRSLRQRRTPSSRPSPTLRSEARNAEEAAETLSRDCWGRSVRGIDLPRTYREKYRRTGPGARGRSRQWRGGKTAQPARRIKMGGSPGPHAELAAGNLHASPFARRRIAAGSLDGGLPSGKWRGWRRKSLEWTNLALGGVRHDAA